MDHHRPESTVDFLEQRYQEEAIPWNLTQPNPVFIRLAKTLKPGKLAIVGAGRGHEVVAFAKQGFQVTAIDFAPKAIQYIIDRCHQLNLEVQTCLCDLFDLPPELNGSFDYVLEQTCYCAIDPKRRSSYEQVVWNLLRPEGELFGLWFPLNKPWEVGGPPWGVDIEEVKSRFQRWVIQDEGFPEDSLPNRQGREYYFRFQKAEM